MRKSSVLAFAILGVIAGSVAEAANPTPAQQTAIKNSCPSDFQSHCAGVTPGGSEALSCLEKNVDKLSSACQSAVKAVMPAAASTAPAGGTTPSANTTAPATTAAPPPVTVQLTPRQEIGLVTSSCSADFHSHCSTVALGGGRAVACLIAHGPQLSATCRGALQQAGQRF